MIRLSPLLQFLARVSLLAVFILISACGGGSSSSDSASSLSDNTVDLVTSAFSGSVGDGPIVGATLRIYDKDNNLVQTLVSDSNAHYSTRIKTKGNAYPLTIVVEDGTDLVTGLAPDFRMTSVVSHPSVKRANINPYTTLIVESAGAMPGGLSDENISAARAAIMDQLNFGLDPAFIADPIVTQVTDENAAVIIKASEVLGEMIRRTRDQLLVTGSVVSADDVVNAIADDITDGSIDGVGAKRANGRISAVSTLVSAQVLIEALSNNLNVNGVRATDKLDAAIASTQSSTPTVAMTGDVRINREMLVQVRKAVAAARVLSPSIELSTIADILDNIQDNSLPSDIEPVLPGDTSIDLDAAIALAPFATQEQLEAVNNIEVSVVPGGNTETGNSAPELTGNPPSAVFEGSAYLFQPVATDADGDVLSFSIRNRPGWAHFDGSTGRLSGTPVKTDAGSYSNIVISVSDGSVSRSLPAFSIVVNTILSPDPVPVPNTAPTISGSPATRVAEDSAYVFQPGASDADGDTLSFSISNRPSWASINSSSGRLSGTPAQGNAGTYSNIVISVSDGSETAGLPAFSIRVDAVAPANNAPVINGTPARTVVAGNSYEFQPSATDADGNPLTFSISNKPNWASFNTATGKLSGAPGVSDQGFYDNIVISVGDGTDLVSLAAFSIRVDAAVSAARVVTDLVAYYPFTEGAGGLITDQSGNGAPMDLTITGSVNWLGGGNGVMMNGGRVGTSGAATKMIDALRLSNTSSFEVWVKPANLTQSGPTRMVSLASGTSQQNFMIGQVGSGVEVRLMHEGKDVSGQPRLTTGNGVLSVSPIHLVHTYDGAVERLYVNGVRHSETVAIGGAYRNWDVLGLFSIGNEASLNRPYAGVIYLVAVYDRALGVAEIQQNFSAGPGNTGDSGGSESLNTAPIISGSPAGSALAGNSYSFQPNATDADGDSLAFSISNKPGWASFDVVTGRLTGAPSDADAGTYSNVVISVTDGVEVVSLAAFSIQVDVAQTQTGSFTLSWTAPVSRADGTSLSLSEIAGYRIHYGVSPGSYSSSIDGGNGAAQTKTVNNIPAGTYYVVMTTRDSGGRESGYSQMVTKVTQ